MKKKRKIKVLRKRKVLVWGKPIKVNPTTSALIEAIGDQGAKNNAHFDRVIKGGAF